MGKLVEFDPRRRAAPKPAGQSGDAQILIFTGIRYERGATQPTTSRLDPTRPKRKRG